MPDLIRMFVAAGGCVLAALLLLWLVMLGLTGLKKRLETRDDRNTAQALAHIDGYVEQRSIAAELAAEQPSGRHHLPPEVAPTAGHRAPSALLINRGGVTTDTCHAEGRGRGARPAGDRWLGHPVPALRGPRHAARRAAVP